MADAAYGLWPLTVYAWPHPGPASRATSGGPWS